MLVTHSSHPNCTSAVSFWMEERVDKFLLHIDLHGRNASKGLICFSTFEKRKAGEEQKLVATKFFFFNLSI